MKNEIVLYRPNELAEHIEVRFDEDTAWLTQAQIADLLGTKSQAITKHINNIFNSGELDKASELSKIDTAADEGAVTVTHDQKITSIRGKWDLLNDIEKRQFLIKFVKRIVIFNERTEGIYRGDNQDRSCGV